MHVRTRPDVPSTSIAARTLRLANFQFAALFSTFGIYDRSEDGGGG